LPDPGDDDRVAGRCTWSTRARNATAIISLKGDIDFLLFLRKPAAMPSHIVENIVDLS
jgi:hypothetical protein